MALGNTGEAVAGLDGHRFFNELCGALHTGAHVGKIGAGVTSAVLSTDEVTLEKSAFLSTLIAAIPVHRGVSRVRGALLSMDRAAVKPARSRMSAIY